MTRLIPGVIIGMALAITASWLYDSWSTTSAPDVPVTVVRDIHDVPRMSESEAQSHRANRFESLTTLEQTLAFPSDFDQTEALYVLAGRSNSDELQDLIQQANRVSDASDRRGAFSILFSRLSDVDPESAVALSGIAPFANEQKIASWIWRSWSRRDLDAALEAVVELTPASRKNAAAQAIYGAYGYTGNDDTAYIESVLAIAPSNWVKGEHIQSLASDSPATAIAYLNQLPVSEQGTLAWSLGSYLGRTYPSMADNFVSSVDNLTVRASLERAVISSAARSAPEEFLRGWMDQANAQDHMNYVSTAFGQLALTDMDAALDYYELLDDPQVKSQASMNIIQAMAAQDPAKALEWARNTLSQDEPGGYMQAIAVVATIDPLAALEELNNVPAGTELDNAKTSVIAAIAQSDPYLAISVLDQLDSGYSRHRAAGKLVSTWVQQNPQAAFEWSLANNERYGGKLLQQIGGLVIRQDPVAAMQYLSQMDDATSSQWASQIVVALADTRSTEEAMAFLEQYRNTPEYEKMQVSLISSISRRRPEDALRLAEQMPAGQDRDRMYTQLIHVTARTDISNAQSILDRIDGDDAKAEAASSLVNMWSHRDFASARQWVQNLPAGKTRDYATMTLVHREPSVDTALRLAEQIGDSEVKKSTVLAIIPRVMHEDPQRAQTILDGMSLTDQEREQINNSNQNWRLRPAQY